MFDVFDTLRTVVEYGFDGVTIPFHHEVMPEARPS